MDFFKAKIQIIGINPYVVLPASVLKNILKQAGRINGPIQVKGTIDGHAFIQTLVRYGGKWRLYLNTPMRKAAGLEVGDTAGFSLEYDPAERSVVMPNALQQALDQNEKIRSAFDELSPYRQKEIKRYINNLKTEDAIMKNVQKIIARLAGKV